MRRIKTAATPGCTPDVSTGAAHVYLRNLSREFPVSLLSMQGRHVSARIVVRIRIAVT
ncbi:MAG: hypothetical protein J0H36_00935 [Hyphomicrobium denitrificans]|nr:hypothetical protein [Hyphomicrobium denitrificans]